MVVLPARGETLQSLAQRYLGDANKDWVIADANKIDHLVPHNEVLIPLVALNPLGVYPGGYQTVPILCYHRIAGGSDQLSVSQAAFEEQMAYLKDNNYRVIKLSELYSFIRGNSSLPKRSVVLTFDDGHSSIFTAAYPILKRHGFPATIFAYTDYINNGGVTWKQIDQMMASGLVDVQPHSKTHSNLAMRQENEDKLQYTQRIRDEIRIPTQQLSSRAGSAPYAFAYPYGDTTQDVIDELKQNEYKLGLTVQSGGNPFFAYTYMLQRTMILNRDDIEAFKAKLDTFHSL